MKDTSKTKVAIVTGAAGDIGQALVHEFSEAGYYVVATDLEGLEKKLPSGAFVQADLRKTVVDQQYANKTFAKIRQKLLGRQLNVLVNNAASQVLGKVEALKREDWNQTLQVNLLAPFFWIQAFLPELEESRGNIVNISSIHAHLSKPEFTAYATSKAALSGMTRSLALELGDRVRVNAIEPAAIDTKMLREGFVTSPADLSQLEAYHPTNSIGSAEEVGRVAVMISDTKLQFLNGASIQLDGGISGRLNDPV